MNKCNEIDDSRYKMTVLTHEKRKIVIRGGIKILPFYINRTKVKCVSGVPKMLIVQTTMGQEN